MTIGVDAGCLGVADERLKVGVYQFAFHLLKHLTRLDKKNKYLLYSFIPIEDKVMSQFGKNVENKVLLPTVGWLSFRVSWELLVNKPDLFLGLSQALPILHPGKTLVFVHDLAFEHFPACYKETFTRLSRQTRFAVRYADKIVAISHATKNDLVRFYGVGESKIEVVYHGVSDFSTPGESLRVASLGESYPYFLFVGSLKPVKNVSRIIEAFASFLKQTKKKYKLVLAGGDLWLDKEIKTVISRLKLDREIEMRGFVPREDLPALYSGAKAFISPSLYEGFGLPILEAFACGTPVITGNTGSMPEVAGEAAFLIDPFDTEEISQALVKMDRDGDLVLQLRKKGRERVKKFSWEKTAEKLLDIMIYVICHPDENRDPYK